MKKIIYNKFDKHWINNLPQVSFPGRIVVVLSPSDTEPAVDYLLSSDILGIDTETRPVFKKGLLRKVALLQVSTRDVCFLFRLNYTGMSPAILRLLENKDVPMVGLSLHDDILSLHRRQDFEPGRFIDLQDMVGHIGIEDLSLQKVYANVFRQKISKRQRLTNWEADVLNDKQKVYAATDAWTCINLYEEIRRLETTGDYELRIVPEPEQSIVVQKEGLGALPSSQ
ncbi:MAG: 3'-5' exonuclease domain-containing protein 2 [Prevotella sp.]|jgi:ribonuclease D|nr:3'-5' exonuclease domain-containing protein 2 [Prevotella sp.]MCI2079921.1 3'-5' exonuclease domain-containing protein 2 [Prevotella sp.]MCI2101763.1 3'-5' exonuclease domain-containing protein 2 [Prevotella sp.]HCN53687.1 3'-5' exonuclease [Prevotella sp.]